MTTQPDIQSTIAASFERQRFMSLLGARLGAVKPGSVEIQLPCRDDLAQQHGFTHAGAIAAIADSACGYAALTLMPPGSEVLSVEFKINLLAPAAGDSFLAVAHVVRAGRTVSVCQADVFAIRGTESTAIAVMQGTMIRRGHPGEP